MSPDRSFGVKEVEVMRNRFFLSILICAIISCGAFAADVRTYRQFKDVAAKENGKVSQSSSSGNLFEYTYSIDTAKKMIVRTKIRRLDEKTARDDATTYNIMEEKQLLGSDAGNGGDAIVAVEKNGTETLVLSHRFAFTSRLSPFSQVITGVYRRVYNEDKDHDRDNDKKHHKHTKA